MRIVANEQCMTNIVFRLKPIDFEAIIMIRDKENSNIHVICGDWCVLYINIYSIIILVYVY